MSTEVRFDLFTHFSFKQAESFSLAIVLRYNAVFSSSEMYMLADSPEAYHYLSQSGCVKDRSLDDKHLYDSVMVSQYFAFSVFDSILDSRTVACLRHTQRLMQCNWALINVPLEGTTSSL